ncbi:hypothetical protein VYU27_010307, partial [Nannochloropsis oceanica]
MVFVIFYKSATIEKKIVKICDAFSARRYPDLSGQWEDWLWTVVREKSIYHTLNLFKSDVSGMLRGEGWVVKASITDARRAIAGAHNRYESAMPSLLEKVPLPWPTPPTYFETNSFTWAFQ